MDGWIEYGKSWKNFCGFDDSLSQWTGDNVLAKSGIEVIVDDVSYLIGDINCNGGICDDCKAFEGSDIVARYRVLVKR